MTKLRQRYPTLRPKYKQNLTLLQRYVPAGMYADINKAVKYLNISLRQIYQSNLELIIRVQKIEDQILFYGSKYSGLLCWKLKTLW